MTQELGYSLQRPPIAFLYCGDSHPVFADDAEYNAWMEEFFEVQMIAGVQPVFLRKETSGLSLEYLEAIVQWIQESYEEYEGFVVLLPRERVVYGSQLLEMMLKQIGKPVICTADFPAGTNIRFRDYNSMLVKSLFMHAVQVAASPIAGVSVIAGQEVVAPTLAVVDYGFEHPIIRSATRQTVGRIQFGFVPSKKVQKAFARNNSLGMIVDSFSPDAAAYLDLDSDFPHNLKQIMRERRQSVIVDGGNTLPLALLSHIPKQIPTLLVADDGMQFVHKGRVHDVSAPTKFTAASRLTWLTAHSDRLSSRRLIDGLQQWNGMGALSTTGGV